MRSVGPTLSSAGSTAGGAVRTWHTVGDFVREDALARYFWSGSFSGWTLGVDWAVVF